MSSTLLSKVRHWLGLEPPDTGAGPDDEYVRPRSMGEDDWFDRLDSDPTIEI